jgi:hypothetical protein
LRTSPEKTLSGFLAASLFFAIAFPTFGGEVPLSSLDLSQARQAWGRPSINRSVGGNPLTIGSQKFNSGFGTHAPGILKIDLHGGSIRFRAKTGIDAENGRTGDKGNVTFFVEGDGKILWQSPPMKGGMPAQTVDVDLTGVQKLILRIAPVGDNNRDAHADWADAVFSVTGAPPTTETLPPPAPRWKLGDDISTFWPVKDDGRLPHEDFIEQGGLKAGQVVNYAIDEKRNLRLRRSVIWPGLRLKPNLVHDTLVHAYGPEADPAITIDKSPAPPVAIDRVVLDGTLKFEGTLGQDLSVVRTTFPSRSEPVAIDSWTLRNIGKETKVINVAPLAIHHEIPGPYGMNLLDVSSSAPASTSLAPGQEIRFLVIFAGRLANEPKVTGDFRSEEKKRRDYVASLQGNLRLETPQPTLNRAFAFSKIRLAEAINSTRAGLLLAPGGLAYYAACWANDNVEYAGPFFPFLGDAIGNQATFNTYQLFQSYMKPDYGKMPSAIVAEGTSTWTGAGDRGDAAMFAYGCSRFCLALGDRATAEKLWHGITWALEYCERRKTADGVIASESDELEHRFPSGPANLATSSLCYGGLRSAADLARSLGRTDQAKIYDRRAGELAQAIEKYFGATVEGFETYRYYDGNEILRAWICLPLCMGLMDRREATLSALFSPRLWTPDGLATQAGERTFWDRSTLYGLRGAFQAGDTTRALNFLTAYTNRRLLGEHVPYPVEAWPEGGQRHLSSENALYCRIFTEGLFGILPTGLNSFRCTPHLPREWPSMALRGIRAFNRNFDVVVSRRGTLPHLTVTQNNRVVFEKDLAEGASADITLP